ncbi:MAG: ferritin family protein [Proteobacteria bacterium]|nr:rubrerythrin [Desulfobacteraceae bacterium]MBU4053452.1 ferritin family protein [Pseudomonadota bacterium]MBU4315905.1 ferritin family protein [Pseudomonadota bacterium]MBU4471395.1 ferritin family protein [Pseudomonadota bacterium]MCG2752400.1 ferritin family protein [Desulfobacteraceae bacterium]
MGFEDMKAIIDFAIEKEKEAADFYEGVSKEESMLGAREMLREFAQEERKHQALLERMLTKGISESLSDYKFQWIKDIKRSNYVADMEYEKGMGFNEILLVAMKREEKALELYNTLQVKAENQDQKDIFKMLCQEEAKHKLALETLFDDYMAELGD